MRESHQPPYSLIFMGSPDFAVPSLVALHDDPAFTLSAVFSMPDRPKGRGHKETMTPVKRKALEFGIPVHTPESLKRQPEFIEMIGNLKPQLLVVVAYGLILPKSVLDAATVGAVNLHASLLPAYRGPSPIHFAIQNGDSVTGNTVMLMTEGMDEGDILASESVPIDPEDTLESLHDRLSALGAPLLVRTLHDFAVGKVVPVPQDLSNASYTSKITVEKARIDWGKSGTTLVNLIRAMIPFPGAWAEYEGERLKIGKAIACQPASASASASAAPAAPGTILTASPREGLIVACGNGTTIQILSMQRPGKALLPINEFLRGFSFQAGRLG